MNMVAGNIQVLAHANFVYLEKTTDGIALPPGASSLAPA